jgi:hypothetical protein
MIETINQHVFSKTVTVRLNEKEAPIEKKLCKLHLFRIDDGGGHNLSCSPEHQNKR